MSELDNQKIKKLIHSLGLKYNMSDEDMENLVHSPYEFAREKIKQLNLEEIKNEEDFNKIKTNFIFRSFFKLVIDYKDLENRKIKKNGRRN